MDDKNPDRSGLISRSRSVSRANAIFTVYSTVYILCLWEPFCIGNARSCSDLSLAMFSNICVSHFIFLGFNYNLPNSNYKVLHTVCIQNICKFGAPNPPARFS